MRVVLLAIGRMKKGPETELAQRYLADRKRPLSEVSSMLGFSATSGFSRWYRRQFGATASERRGASQRRSRKAGTSVN